MRFSIEGLAMLAGLHNIWIAIAFATFRVGDTGNRSLGSFDGIIFLSPLLLAFVLSGLRMKYKAMLGRVGHIGLLFATIGMSLGAIGSFGGYWMNFPRSGNYLSFPGSILVFGGLIAFGVVAIKKRLPSIGTRFLPLLIAISPIPFLWLRGLDIFLSVPMLSETALVVLHTGFSGFLWFLFGYVFCFTRCTGLIAQTEYDFRKENNR